MKKRQAAKTVVVSVFVLGVCGILLYQLLFGFGRGGSRGQGQEEEKGIWGDVSGTWVEEDGISYYVGLDGNRVTGDQVIDGMVYRFGGDGAWDGEEPLPVSVISAWHAEERVLEEVISDWHEEMQKEYVSLTGGRTWVNDAVPECYMTVESTTYPRDAKEVTVTFHNNGENMVITGLEYQLYHLEEGKWVWGPGPWIFSQEGFGVPAKGTLEIANDLMGKDLEPGRYRLIKHVIDQYKNQMIFFAVEFELL